MKSKNIILLFVLVILVIIVFYAFRGSQDDPAYVERINQAREEKDDYMRTAAESPFAKVPEKFSGLKYFPPDHKYRFIADFYPIENKKVVVLKTNDGKEQRYLEYGNAAFELAGVKNQLLILEAMEAGPYRGKLFLAFGDETSARETYGAGRYLDLNKVPGSTSITLDFNEAYNPYCAYNDTFSCPFPPAENLLQVAIKAGEKNYH
jgi:uncharacterized protein (DUF1684 family)